jgi:hypothetical protein
MDVFLQTELAPPPNSGMAEDAKAAFKDRYQEVKGGADDHRSEA